MKIRLYLPVVFIFLHLLFSSSVTYSQELKTIQLPQPKMHGGRPFMEVLKDRQSQRSISPDGLSLQTISNMLWAAWGINRPESGMRTAPSALNNQEVDVYVVTADGAYLYDAEANCLERIISEDIRNVTARQTVAQRAHVNLVYVADYSKMGDISKKDKDFMSAADTGYISQNVYLFCASEGLANFVYYGIFRLALAGKLKLKPSQKVILAQAVGFPKEGER